jgi:hypothetical protein
MRKFSLFTLALLMWLWGVADPVRAGQGDPPSMTMDDIEGMPERATSLAEAEAEEAEAVDADATPATVKTSKRASTGYVRVSSSRGYAFERPTGWVAEDLEVVSGPTYFSSDAIFRDPKSGAVLTAGSVDRTKLQQPIDIGDPAAVSNFLAKYLNPAGLAEGPRIIKQDSGVLPASGLKWVRVKAEGVAVGEDEEEVDASFWVQMVQNDAMLAVVAVSYPSSNKAAAEKAFHSARTLEITNVSKPAGEQSAGDDGGEATSSAEAAAPAKAATAAGEPAGASPEGTKKNRAGGVRKP